MRGRSSAVGTAVCLLLTAPVCAQGLAAGPEAAARPRDAQPAVQAAAADGATASAGWSPQEIQLAQARCAVLLKGLEVVAVPEVPLREGSECGAPAPMRLISIGKAPQVAFSPPPTLTCDMIAVLHKWLQADVQPLARQFMGAPVVRVETMSSYSCRNAYGRAHGRLSEHARANALDIGAFITALGKTALVVTDWGLTAREVAAAAADTKAQAASSQTASTPRQAPAVAAAGPAQGLLSLAPAALPSGGASAASMTGFSFPLPGLTLQAGSGTDASAERSFGSPQRLGGPKAKAAAAAQGTLSAAHMDFLRGAHAAACRRFGTALGPEANPTHKNHFHLDMADRPHGTICE